MQMIQVDTQHPITTITLNQPDVHNAFDDIMIEELLVTLNAINEDPEVKVVQLRAQGDSFSAGANLNWMKKMKDYSYEENIADARDLAELMHTLYTLKKPTIAVVQGPAIGGGVGLVSCCDIAVAAKSAFFCFSEVKLGLIPAVISPYVINAIGARQASRYFLTAEKIDSLRAYRLGLIHKVVNDSQLEESVDEFTQRLLNNGPQALLSTKELIERTGELLIDQKIINYTTEQIAKIRVSEEGQEGLAAFIEKRLPKWRE